MSLILSSSQLNNPSTTSEPQFQDWGPITNETIYFWSNAAPGLLMSIPVDFKIKDVIGVPEYGQYSEFRLASYQAYNESAPLWLMPLVSPPYPVLYISPIPITTTGITYSYYPIFQNLGIMPEGNYSFTHHFIIQGKNSSNNWVDISSYNYNTRLIVSNQAVSFTPASLSYTHFQNTTLPSQDITVTGPLWTVRANPYLDLSSATPGVTITTITPTTGEPYQEAQGTGEAVITVTLGSFYDEPLINPNENTLFSQLAILGGSSTQVGIIPISIILENTNQFIVNDNSVEFYGTKTIQEPTPSIVFVTCSEPPFTIQASPWLLVEPAVVDTFGLPLYPLQIVPISTSNMEPGIYAGTVILTATIDGVISTITIHVVYTLDGFISSPYPSGLAFTLDPLYFNFATNNLDTFFQLVATIKTFDFFTNTLKETTLLEKLPLFNGTAKLNYGKVVHRLMNRFSEPNENEFQYKPAQLNINIEEVTIADRTIVRSTFLQNLKYIAGLERVAIHNRAFLEFNSKSDRVTLNSEYYLNILIPNGNFGLQVFKNGIFVETIPLPFANGTILFKKITFQDYQIGDVILYRINDLSNDFDITPVPEKSFYILPQGKYSNHILWENEFLLQSIFEFTGAVSIKSDFEIRTQNLFKNAVEIMEIIENTKINKLIISTGWIIKSSIDTIESLMRAKRAWLKQEDTTLDLRPISKTMINEDTERELIEYTIEFQINRKYNEETYSL